MFACSNNNFFCYYWSIIFFYIFWDFISDAFDQHSFARRLITFFLHQSYHLLVDLELSIISKANISSFDFAVCYPVTTLMHARVDRLSGKPTYDRAFCIRMKSTLTKRGCHFKVSKTFCNHMFIFETFSITNPSVTCRYRFIWIKIPDLFPD